MFYGGTYKAARVAKQHLRIPEKPERKKKGIIRVWLLLPTMQMNILLVFTTRMRIHSDFQIWEMENRTFVLRRWH